MSRAPSGKTVYQVKDRATLRVMREGQRARALLTRLFEQVDRAVRMLRRRGRS